MFMAEASKKRTRGKVHRTAGGAPCESVFHFSDPRKDTVLIRSIRSSRVTRALAKRKFWPRHASQSPFGGRFAPLGLHLGVISTINGNIRVSGRKTNLLFLVTRHRGWRIDRIDTVVYAGFSHTMHLHNVAPSFNKAATTNG